MGTCEPLGAEAPGPTMQGEVPPPHSPGRASVWGPR